jgi:arsenate reductase (glutaredoxin)
VEIWINPACSKCRTATKALDEAGITYTVRRYLDDPPTPEELTAVLARLNLEPWDLVRHNEPAAKPLIQRPILTADDNTTAVARDPKTLARFLRTNP